LAYIFETVVSLGVVAALAVGFYFHLKESPDFRLKTIRVEGIEMLQEDAIVSQSGLNAEDCLFFVNPRSVRDQVLALPYVSQCNVRRIFPSTVVISVHERIALATLVVNNRLFELDQDANVLRELPPGTTPTGPLITGVPDLNVVEAGTQLPQRPVKAAIGVWRAFCATQVKKSGLFTVSEISAAQENRLCMYCDEVKGEIRWARGDYAKQAWKLDVLWQNQRQHLACKEYIDLRFGDDVACK
jgi:hypothetical protein